MVIMRVRSKVQVRTADEVSNKKDTESRPVRRPNKHIHCPVECTLKVIEGRWKVLIIYYLQDGTKRFNELRRLLDNISHRTLTRQLRELERDGIVDRKVHAQIPPRVDYSLTRLGESLKPVLKSMHDWGQMYRSR